MKETLKVARSLADALLNGLRKRFGAYEGQDDLIVASASHHIHNSSYIGFSPKLTEFMPYTC